jgi:hypothetical protein
VFIGDKGNFVAQEGYFYTVDIDIDALDVVVDNGNHAYAYPLDHVLYDDVLSLEFDGVNFWTLQALYLDGDDPDELPTSMIIKRWRIENYICKLKQTIKFEANTAHKYESFAFTLEHYHTKLTSAATVGDTTIYLDNYYNNSSLIVGSTLYIGPNSQGYYEEVDVTSVVYGGVVLDTPLTYNYAQGVQVLFHKHIYLFNNYDGNDETSGALYKFDSHTGFFKEKYAGGAYKDIKATTFSTVTMFKDLGDVDALSYIKGISLLFVDISTISKSYVDATSYNDDFTGSNGSSPDTSKWLSSKGNLTIYNNSLRSYSTSSGINEIKSNYYLDGSFEVTVSGSLDSYNVSTGEYFQHSLGLLFPQESNRYCKISRGYSTEFGGQTFNNFSVVYRKNNDVVASGVVTTSENYILGMRRNIGINNTTINLFYKTVVSGVVGIENTLFSIDMYDTEAQIILSTETNSTNNITTFFDDFNFVSGRVYTKGLRADLPYYGSAYVDALIERAHNISKVTDISMSSENIYILVGDTYVLSPMKSFITAISVTASPAVLPADNYSTSVITAYVTDQYNQPIVGRRVTFIASQGSISGPEYVNTDSDGKAVTELTAGTAGGKGTVIASAPQT